MRSRLQLVFQSDPRGSSDFLVLVTGAFSTQVISLNGAIFNITIKPPFLSAYLFLASLFSKLNHRMSELGRESF